MDDEPVIYQDFYKRIQDDKALNENVRFLERVSYDLLDKDGNDQYPRPNERMELDGSSVMIYWGVDGPINRRALRDLVPAEHDPVPTRWQRIRHTAPKRHRMAAYIAQTGHFQFLIEDMIVQTPFRTYIQIKVMIPVSWDLTQSEIIGPGGDLDGDDPYVTDREKEILLYWGQLLNNNYVEGDSDSNTQEGEYRPGSILRSKFLTVGKIKNILGPYFRSRVLDYFGTLTTDDGFKTEDTLGMQNIIEQALADIYNGETFLRDRNFRINSNPVVELTETPQEKELRIARQYISENNMSELERKRELQKLEDEIMKADIDHKRLAEAYKRAQRDVEMQEAAARGELGD